MHTIITSASQARRSLARRRLSRLAARTRPAHLLLLLLLAACGGGASGSALDAGADAGDAGAQSEDTVRSEQDPTRPDESSGVFRAPGEAFDTQLAALLAYRRPVPPDCPGLLAASSCGNGVCDEPKEDASSCAADCVRHLAGAYNDLPICPDYQRRVEARNVAEVQAAVREAVRAGQRLRAVGAQHSASGALCGDGVVLDMSAFADLGATRVENGVVYVQPGVTLFALGEWLAERGLGIGLSHLGFRAVSVAGAIGTAAHGSSPLHTNTVSHRVAALTLVLADGSERTFREGDTEPTLWRALTTHLGLLGVITEVGLHVEDAFDLDTSLDVVGEAQLLAAPGALTLLKGCDWGQFNWFPHRREALRWCGKRTDSQGTLVDNTLLDPGVTPEFGPAAKIAFQAGTCDASLNATLESSRLQGLLDNPPLLVRAASGNVRVMHAVGPAHRMVSSDLIALGSEKYFQMDWEVAIPEQYIQLALSTARQVFDAHDVSLPGVGVFLRFGKIERGSWLSYHSAGRQFKEGQTALFFEMPVAVPAGYNSTQLADYLHIYRELIGLFIRHLGARAHWGKNSDAVFAEQVEAGTYAGRIERMNEAIAQLDPYGVFGNAFAEAIGITWPKRGQALGREDNMR